MGSWQRRTRIGLAIFGVALAAVVYFSMGERRSQAPPAPVQRSDPKSIFEGEQVGLQRLRQTQQDFSITSSRTVSYEDGSQKMFAVEITVRKSDGRSYVVTADEATAGKDQRVRYPCASILRGSKRSHRTSWSRAPRRSR